MTELERECRSPPMGLPLPSDIVLELLKHPEPLECPWDEDYDDSNEYGDLIIH